MNSYFIRRLVLVAPLISVIGIGPVFASTPSFPPHISDIRDDDCTLEPGTSYCDPNPEWKERKIKNIVTIKENQHYFLAPPPITW